MTGAINPTSYRRFGIELIGLNEEGEVGIVYTAGFRLNVPEFQGIDLTIRNKLKQSILEEDFDQDKKIYLCQLVQDLSLRVLDQTNLPDEEPVVVFDGTRLEGEQPVGYVWTVWKTPPESHTDDAEALASASALAYTHEVEINTGTVGNPKIVLDLENMIELSQVLKARTSLQQVLEIVNEKLEVALVQYAKALEAQKQALEDKIVAVQETCNLIQTSNTTCYDPQMDKVLADLLQETDKQA